LISKVKKNSESLLSLTKRIGVDVLQEILNVSSNDLVSNLSLGDKGEGISIESVHEGERECVRHFESVLKEDIESLDVLVFPIREVER
jgi:hypothetical protein